MSRLVIVIPFVISIVRCFGHSIGYKKAPLSVKPWGAATQLFLELDNRAMGRVVKSEVQEQIDEDLSTRAVRN